MADSKISDLSAATTLAGTELMEIVQSSSNKKLTLDNLGNLGGYKRWTLIGTSKYTATPASTSRVTMSDTSDMYVGAPLKYTYNSSTYYGIVSAISANSYIDIKGAALNTGQNLTALSVGRPEMAVQVNLFVPSTYATSTQDLLANKANAYCKWRMGAAYLVAFSGAQKTADSTSNPKVNVKVNGNAVSTADSNNGIQLSTAGTWVDNSAIAINTSNYAIANGDAIEVACTAAGGTQDAANLSINALAVLA